MELKHSLVRHDNGRAVGEDPTRHCDHQGREQDLLDDVNDADKIEELEDQREVLTYQMLELMLVPSGDAQMDAEFLREHLDIEDAGDLLSFVGPGEDPTPAPTEGSSTG